VKEDDIVEVYFMKSLEGPRELRAHKTIVRGYK